MKGKVDDASPKRKINSAKGKSSGKSSSEKSSSRKASSLDVSDVGPNATTELYDNSIDDILDFSVLSKAEQRSKMYRNMLTVFSMCANKPLTYEQVNDYMHSLYGKFTGSKTTCVYWRDTMTKENIPCSCTDPTCQEEEAHRICKKAVYRKTLVIWVQRDIAKKLFKEYNPSWERFHESNE